VPDGLSFSTLPVTSSTEICSLCKATPACFRYEMHSDDPSFHQLSGICCLACGTNLSAGLEEVWQARTQPGPTAYLLQSV